MPTVFINNLAVPLPVRFVEGDILSDNAAALLNDIHLKRVKAKLRWMLQRGDIDAQCIEAKGIELMAAELVPYTTTDDEEEDDPVVLEALVIARDMIGQRMAAEGLPLPKGIDLHAKALVDGSPEIMERARRRVEAKYKAAADALGDLL